MNRKNLIAWLAAPLLAFSLACETEGGGPEAKPESEKPADPRPGCPGVQWRADYERCFTIQTFVESRLGPYDVYIEIVGGNGAYPPHVPIAAGGWTHAVVYRTGVEMTVKVTLRYEGEESRDGFCSITDGKELYKQRLKSIRGGGGSPYQAVCALTTSQ
jgi:hypothetical protein